MESWNGRPSGRYVLKGLIAHHTPIGKVLDHKIECCIPRALHRFTALKLAEIKSYFDAEEQCKIRNIFETAWKNVHQEKLVVSNKENQFCQLTITERNFVKEEPFTFLLVGYFY